jgi:hypothetical protein
MSNAAACCNLFDAVGEVLLLSLAASLNPTLVAATTVMLLLPDPAKLMGAICSGR